MIYNLLKSLNMIWFPHALTTMCLRATNRPIRYMLMSTVSSYCKNPFLEETKEIPHFMCIFINKKGGLELFPPAKKLPLRGGITFILDT